MPEISRYRREAFLKALRGNNGQLHVQNKERGLFWLTIPAPMRQYSILDGRGLLPLQAVVRKEIQVWKYSQWQF